MIAQKWQCLQLGTRMTVERPHHEPSPRYVVCFELGLRPGPLPCGTLIWGQANGSAELAAYRQYNQTPERPSTIPWRSPLSSRIGVGPSSHRRRTIISQACLMAICANTIPQAQHWCIMKYSQCQWPVSFELLHVTWLQAAYDATEICVHKKKALPRSAGSRSPVPS